MGQYGVSFPFLIGVLKMASKNKDNKKLIITTLEQIIKNPTSGYYCEVRWCSNIDEPVISIESNDTIASKAIQAKFTSETGEISLAFTSDLMSMLHLDCTTKEDCLNKLITKTQEMVDKNLFSKNNGTFGEFTENERNFINDVLKDNTYI